MAHNNVLRVTNSSELLSFIINQTPELASDIDLPVQGESIAPIGKLIMNNQRYKNAFINTFNLVGLTVIDRNAWQDPWESFTEKGKLEYGQQIREIIEDLCTVFDYNEEFNNNTKFLETFVPNIFNYLHEVNFQKVYGRTVTDLEFRMAFQQGTLLDLLYNSAEKLNTTYHYDKYITSKYMLCRRILDGTIKSIKIDDNLSAEDKLTIIKSHSNKMTFMKPFYNPAGVHKAVSFDEQFAIVNTDYEAVYSTKILAKSYFKDEAEMKSHMALIDGFDEHDIDRLTLLLKEKFIPFTEEELNQLSYVQVCLVGKDFFQNYRYAFDNDSTNFENPTNLKKNQFLHAERCFSTSPFENAVVFTSNNVAVTSVSVTPSTATISAGLSLPLTATVTTTGFANKAVTWKVNKAKCSIDLNGNLKTDNDIASGTEITVTATSVFDKTKKGTATITIA